VGACAGLAVVSVLAAASCAGAGGGGVCAVMHFPESKRQ